MPRPHTDSTANKPVTLPRNKLLIRYWVTGPDHTVTLPGTVTPYRDSVDGTRNHVSFFEIFSSVKLVKDSNSLGDILVKFLYNPPTE